MYSNVFLHVKKFSLSNIIYPNRGNMSQPGNPEGAAAANGKRAGIIVFDKSESA